MQQSFIRNLAIIAHVDHGKTTLVDGMLRQSGIFHEKQVVAERVMDRNELERERGITILSKNTSIQYRGYCLNIVDTPGHADFGGEVERIVQMVDGALLVVDAFEGPMPQTRFVLRKALEAGLMPIVVINKVDRPNARPDVVLDCTLDLFIELGAREEQLDFPYVFTNARLGFAGKEPDRLEENLIPLFETIIQHIPAPSGDANGILQMGVCMIEYDSYVGRQAVGRVASGSISEKEHIAVVTPDGEIRTEQVAGLYVFNGLKKERVATLSAGQIGVVVGLSHINVGETITSVDEPMPLEFVKIEEPMVAVRFQVNASPFAGEEGTYVTSRKLFERLQREAESDVSLRIKTTDSPDAFEVQGRGELHLSILIEKMRREDYEFEISRPVVLTKVIDGKEWEPIEELVVDVPDEFVGAVIEKLGARKAELEKMLAGGNGRTELIFHVPTRSLFGYRSQFLTDTKGLGIMYHAFKEYQPAKGKIEHRTNGALVAFETGMVTAYGIENAQLRGTLFVKPGDRVYRGQIVGENSRPTDLAINVCKQKKLTNMRSATAEITTKLVPPCEMTLEECLEFIADDELVEVTPKSIRMRKRSI